MYNKPDFKITTATKDITRQLNERVQELELTQRSGGLSDELTLVVDDHQQDRMDLPKPGDKIGIALGYTSDKELEDQGQYEVFEYALNGSGEKLNLYANKLYWNNAIKAPRHNSWPSDADSPLTLKSLFDDIAGRHGLTSRISDELGQIQLPNIEQNESDLHLMARLASNYDATMRIVDDYLVLMPRSSGHSQSGKAMPEIRLNKEMMLNWEMLCSDYLGYRSCKAYYHDWVAARRQAVTVGDSAPCYELPHPLADELSARHAATARLNDYLRTQKTLTATTIGNPKLMADAVLILEGLREGIDGRWSLTQVRHRIDARGYITQFECEQLSR